MPKKSQFIGAAVLVVVAAAAAATMAVASSASVRSAGDGGLKSIRLDVHSRPFAQNYVDVGASGPGVGDQSVFQDVLRNARKQRVGFEVGSCVFTALHSVHVQTECLGTAFLPGGQISFQGAATDAPVKRLAVVGGTGRYRQASGVYTLTEFGHDDAGRLVISLLDLGRQP
jgi:hypothetical protein